MNAGNIPIFLGFTPLKLLITILNIINLTTSIFFTYHHSIVRRRTSPRQEKYTTQRLLFFSISVIMLLCSTFLLTQHIIHYSVLTEDPNSVILNALNIGHGLFFAAITLLLVSTLYRYRRLLMVLKNTREHTVLQVIEAISIILGIGSIIVALLPVYHTPIWTVYIIGILVLWSSVIECVLNLRMILVTLATEKLPTPTTSNNATSSLSSINMGKQKKLQSLKLKLLSWYILQLTATVIVLSLFLASNVFQYYHHEVTELAAMFGSFDIWFCLVMLDRFRSGVLANGRGNNFNHVSNVGEAIQLPGEKGKWVEQAKSRMALLMAKRLGSRATKNNESPQAIISSLSYLSSGVPEVVDGVTREAQRNRSRDVDAIETSFGATFDSK